MNQTIYYYNDQTGEHAGEGQADQSPLETDAWLIPAYATPSRTLPTGEKEAVLYLAPDGKVPAHHEDGTWRIVADWRGVPLWSTSDGKPLTISALGVSPAEIGATDQPCPSPTHAWENGTWVENAGRKAELLAKTKSALCLEVDAVADAARLAIAGDPLRVVEYERAANEAQTYKDGGYSGTVPPAVKSWAEAKSWSGQQAADNILAEAAAWTLALYGIRDMRLKGKESVRSAADIAAAQVAAEAVISQIRSAVASVGNAQ